MPLPLSLPFELSDASISSWLSQLNKAPLSSGNEIGKILGIIKKQIDLLTLPELELIAQRLTPVILNITPFLVRITILHPEQNKPAQLGGLLMRRLAFLHFYLAQQQKRTEQKSINQYCHNALYLYTWNCYCNALSGEQLPYSISENAALIWDLVKIHKLGNLSIVKPLAPALDNIAKTLQFFLSFKLCCQFRFPVEDTQTLFNFCNKFFMLLDLNPHLKQKNDVFYWNLEQPQFISRTYNNPTQTIAFNSAAIAKLFQKPISNLSAESQFRMASLLTNFHDIAERVSYTLPRPAVFVSRYQQVVEFLATHVRDNKVTLHNSPSPTHLNFSSLDLVQANKPKREYVHPNDIWGETRSSKIKLHFGAIKVYKSETDNFFGAESMKVDLVVNDLLVFYDQTLTPTLGITRRIEPKIKDSVIEKTLIETLDGRLNAGTTTIDAQKIPYILLNGIQSKELFLPAGKFNLKEPLSVNDTPTFLLHLIEENQNFVRFLCK